MSKGVWLVPTFLFEKLATMDFAAAFWEHNIYKIPQRNLRPCTVKIQVDIEGGTQDGVKRALIDVFLIVSHSPCPGPLNP